MSCKINFAYFTRKHLCWSLFLIKLQSLTWKVTKKGTLTQVFSCEFFELFKNTNSSRRLLLLFNGFLNIRISQLTYNGSSHQIIFCRTSASEKYERKQTNFTINIQCEQPPSEFSACL